MKRSFTLFLSLILMTGWVHAQNLFLPSVVDSAVNGPAGVCITDLDKDGLPDILCAASDGDKINWYRNTSAGETWTFYPVASGFHGAIYVRTGDLNNDGHIDVVAAAWNGHELAWWENDGSFPPQWTKHQIRAGYTNAHEVMPADLDGDSDLDVIGVSAGLNTISWFENSGTNPVTWTEHLVTANFAGARSVDTTDIDGDGDIDLAGAAFAANRITWWRNDGGSPVQWAEFEVDSLFTQAHKVHIIDIDIDGKPDILGTSFNNGLNWYKNNGGDTIGWTKNFISGFYSAVISYAFDADLDGDIDVAASAQSSGKVALWLNKGTSPITWQLNVIDNLAGAWPLHYGDIDLDGCIDLVCGGFSADKLKWYANNLVPVITDYDGNVYHQLTIGNQYWLRENLSSLHYDDGAVIPDVASYNNSDSLASIYGRLYTWDAAMRQSNIPGSQGVCPSGWHVPTDEEWTELENFLGGATVAGGKMKEPGYAHWSPPNTGGNNSSGFMALPAGEYDAHQFMRFQLLNTHAVFWTSTWISSNLARERYLSYDNASSATYDWYKSMKYSIRCIRDIHVGMEKQHQPEKFRISTSSDGSLLILSDEAGTWLLRLFDAAGRMVISTRFDPILPCRVNASSSLKSGIYVAEIVRLNDDAEPFRLKWIKP